MNKDKSYEKTTIKKSQKNIKEFEKIYIDYNQKIFRYFLTRVNTNETAEDLTSVTFEKALKNIKSFQWQGISISAWLYQIARNTLIDYYRQQAKKKSVTLTDESVIADTTSIENDFITTDSSLALQKILNSLPERERKIVRLKFYEGMTNKQIAKELNISETNVSTILHRTMKKLYSLISDFEEFIPE